MASFLLAKHPELLLGGDSVGLAAYRRCETFWQRFRNTQPDHAVYKRFGAEELKRVIPVCMHGDKGRTLKKSPIAVFSFEAVWGLPEGLRQCAVEPDMKRKNEKYEYGHLLAQTCPERRASLSVSRPTLDPHGACPCTIDLRRQGASMDEVQTHNTLGNLRLALARVDVKLNTIPMWGFLKSCFPKTSILRRLSDLHSELSVLGTPILGHLQSASAISPSQIVIICSKSLPQYLYGVRLGTV